MDTLRIQKFVSRNIDWDSLWNAEQLKTTAILLSAPLLLTAQRYYGSMEFFIEHFGKQIPLQDQDLFASIYFFSSSFLLLGVVPFLLVRFVFRERLRDYGLCLGDWRKGLLALLILTPLIALALLLPSSHQEDFRTYYPFAKSVKSSFDRFVSFEILRGLLFYSAWEFFFRGFMLLGLKSAFGEWQSVLIQVIPSCLWHIGTPDGEIFGSIAGGILFGILVLRTRSLMYAFILHWSIGFLLDFFILYL